MLALSSMSRRSLYVGLAWVGLFLIGWVVAGVLGGIHHESIRRDIMLKEQALNRAGAEYEHQRTWWQRQGEIEREIQQAERESQKTDWRPLFSYTADLGRLGAAILNTDAAWVQIGRVYEQRRSQLESMSGMSPGPWADSDHPETVNERRLAEFWLLQYPWTWSAAVLAGLWGLSLCILCTRVKSLDRLR